MIIGIQLVGIIFSFSMIYFAILHFKRREINMIEIVIWLLVWMFVLVAVLFPDLLQSFARSFYFVRLFDMMVVGAILLMITMTVKTYVSMRRMEKTIEDLVRTDSLKNSIKKTRR